MTSLKQEMREMFERRSSMNFYESNSGFEEGLLEKIVNLAYASFAPYCAKCWKLAAIHSPVLLHRLSRAVGDNRIADCAVALVIGADTSAEDPFLKLFSLSVGYAAKYYCIDHFVVLEVDAERIKREWPAIPHVPAGIIGLGFFRDTAFPRPGPRLQNYYEDLVTVIG